MLRAAKIILPAIICISGFAFGQVSKKSVSDIALISVDSRHESVRPGGRSSVAIKFQLKSGWHFYASEKTARFRKNRTRADESENSSHC